MTSAQKTAATEAAINTLTRLIDNAPDYGECGCTLIIHGGELRNIAETCKRTLHWGHTDAR